VFEALGVTISLSAAGVRRCVEEAGIGFLFAPAFHPAMRHAAAVRGELGIRTAFNVLGPLANPARVRHQALGVGDPAVAATMAQVLLRLGLIRAWVFAGPDGLDELGLTGPAQCYEVTPAGVRLFSIDPRDLGLAAAPVEALRGGTAEQNAEIIREVLGGEAGPARDVVVLNAAAALVAADHAAGIEAALPLASGAIDSGAATAALDTLVRVSRAVAA
jgi:anthranilate phosphoribosyltransferase